MSLLCKAAVSEQGNSAFAFKTRGFAQQGGCQGAGGSCLCFGDQIPLASA